MSLESDFPGLTKEIDLLRRNGLDDESILRAISERANFHSKAGRSGEAVDAWLKGRPGPITAKLDKDVPLQLQPDKIQQLKDFQQATTIPKGVDSTGRRPVSLWQSFFGKDPYAVKQAPGFVEPEGPLASALSEGPTEPPVARTEPPVAPSRQGRGTSGSWNEAPVVVPGKGVTVAPGAPQSRQALPTIPMTADRRYVESLTKNVMEEFYPGMRLADLSRSDPKAVEDLEYEVKRRFWSPLPKGMETEKPTFGITPKGRGASGSWDKPDTSSTDVYWGAVKRAAGANDLVGVLQAGGVGLARGMMDAAAASGKVAMEEMREGPEQFVQGMKKVWQSQNMLEMGMGAVEGVLGAARALPPIAAGTGLARSTWERAVKPMVPKSIGESPTAQMVGEFALQAPFMGIGAMRTAGARTGAEVATSKMVGETSRNAATLRQMLKDGKIPADREPMVEELIRLASGPTESPARGGIASGEQPPSAPPRPVAGTTVEEGVVIADASNSPRPSSVKLEKVETEGGMASVVDRSAEGEVFVTKLPEDSGAATAARADAGIPESAPSPLEKEVVKKKGRSRKEVTEDKLVAASVIAEQNGTTPAEGLKVAETLTEEQVAVVAKRKRGPKVGEVPTVTEVANIVSPDRPEVGGTELMRYGDLKKLAESRGMEITNKQGKVQLHGNGGNTETFDTLRDAQLYLTTKDAKTVPPVEMKSAATGESALEAAIQGKDLNVDQKASIKAQKVQVAEGLKDLGTPKWDFTLKEGQLLGTTEPMARADALKAGKKAAEEGMVARLVGTSKGWEIVYYKEPSEEVNRLFNTYKSVIGAKGKGKMSAAFLTADDYEALGKAFGLEGVFPISGGAPTGGRLKQWLESAARVLSPDRVNAQGKIVYVNPLAGGMISGSPLVREATKALFWVERSFDHRMKGFAETMKNMRDLVPDIARATALKEGTALPSGVDEASFMAQSPMLARDFARRARQQGQHKLAARLNYYAPFDTDADAMYAVMQEMFASTGNYRDLPGVYRAKITAQDFTQFKNTMAGAPDWGSVPPAMKTKISDDLYNLSSVASKWDSVPTFIKDRLPEELFTRHFLKDHKIYEKDAMKAMESWVNNTESKLSFDPWLDKYNPIIRNLPGSETNWMTEKGFLTKLQNNAILRRPTWDERHINDFVEKLNQTFQTEMFRASDVNAAAQITQHAGLRGMLGVDSAIVNSSGLLYTLAETGRFRGPVAKYFVTKSKDYPTGVFSEFVNAFGDVTTTDTRFMQKALDWDRKLNNVVFAPHNVTEHLTRGIAFQAGMEEALAKGLDGVSALRMGMGRASNIVPNLELSEAQMHAVESVIRTQIGQTPATRAPAFGAKGPFAKLSSMLMSFPGHTGQFLQTGIRQGIADSVLKNEHAKLARFTLLTGFVVTFPIVARQMGADFSNIFGPQSLFPMSMPVFTSLLGAYQAINGETPMKKDQAQQEIWKSLKTWWVPQYRYGAKVADVFQNIERGNAVDKRGRYLYETTTWGEVSRLIGVPMNKAYETRTMSRNLFEQAQVYRLDKMKAVDSLLDGDFEPAKAFMQKWQHQITNEDLQRAMESRQMTPDQRALRSVSPDIRQQLMMQQGR